MPAGCAGGSAVEVLDGEGRAMRVIVPDGLREGDTFHLHSAPNDCVDALLEALTHEGFCLALDAFIGRECHKFVTGGTGEHTIEQSEVHGNYVRLYGKRASLTHGVTRPLSSRPMD